MRPQKSPTESSASVSISKESPKGFGGGGSKPEKIFVTYERVHHLIENSAGLLRAFRPDTIVAIGGGGFVPGRILREHLRARMLAVVLEHSSDSVTGEKHVPTKVQWLDQGCEHLIRSRRVLVVDEVDDTRETLALVVAELAKLAPEAISVFVLHNKMKEKRAEFITEVGYLAAEEVHDAWLVYPWEALDYLEHVNQAKEKKFNPDHLSL